jgi:hypothetical protein
VQAASRQREPVTGRRLAPNSFLEAHFTRFQQWSRTMLTKHLLKIALVAAGRNSCIGPRRLDNHGQELLAK